ncbi:hypothetical protein JHL18_21530 [Clostridium sp. YIM B02505]|uniref:Uncharacterized protein n=1 Tax=Clostridium yunnanense TaxID=2800325 RepID=A0ABS1EV59_9CLOT|nr:hypothetical protein [Clostridium yunnanense]MBK1813208.1 hypothetical protein [Clostridium yunnanense]
MEKSLKLFGGLVAGLVLVYINTVISSYDILDNAFGFVLNGVMRGMSLMGLIIVEVTGVLLFIESIKAFSKKS